MSELVILYVVIVLKVMVDHWCATVNDTSDSGGDGSGAGVVVMS